jgi:predicted MFS family arabinose efflux permease
MSISSALQQLCAGVASYVAGLIVYQGSDGRLYGYNYVGYLAILATLSCLVLARFVRSADGSRY